ncbi:MAG: VCBS repeat-containing protein [Myxococcaceae bacterium]|nr:VCBS repeat-containing protein [Myxococcaceae bacterium]
MLPKRALMLAALVTAATGCDDPKPPENPEPALSQEPSWSLEQDTLNGTSCFGTSLALGDFNGDGRKDLVAARPPCNWAAGQLAGRVAIHVGTESYFSAEAVSAEINWQNTHSRTSGRGIAVSVGNVNGDAYADLLVRNAFGVQIFTGQADLGAMLAAPTFRIPANGTFGAAILSDVNGDGLDDLVSVRLGNASIYLATPQAPEGLFTVAREIPGYGVAELGDTNGDGAEDLLVLSGDESRLHLGCKQGSSLTCEGPATAEPVWSTTLTVRAAFPDQNGDGRMELFLGDNVGGRVWLHLSEASGGYASVPVWSLGGDPLFPGFGSGITPVGDLDGDGQHTEFVMGALGRMYLFTPQAGISADLRPSWAWPGSDSFEGREGGLSTVRGLPVGDLDGDGRDELLVANPPAWESTKPGRVMVFSGGKVPADFKPPYLPEPRNCGVNTSGKPDVTVDADVLSRSLYIERKHFEATSCEVIEGCVGGTGERRLLRFSVSIPNLGAGEVRIPASDTAPELYQWDSCHGHDHLIGFADYTLRDAQDTVTATGRKQGFAMIDLMAYCMDAGPPSQIGVEQVISPGWSDIYTSDLPCQWLDITDLQDGTYSLRVGVDENNLIDEQDTLPNHASVKIRVEGDTVKVEP